MHPSERLEYAALSDRMTALLLLRFAMAAIVAGWAIIRPEILGIDLMQLVAVSGGYLMVALLAFLIIQGRMDERDPKLRRAPLTTAETTVLFVNEADL